jgi:hypothetical protein
METVLNNYGQILLLLMGLVMVAAGYLVENVAVWGVGLRALPVNLSGRGRPCELTGRLTWRSVWYPRPLERCSLTKWFILPR